MPVSAFVDTARRIWTNPENRGRRLRRTAGWVGWQAWERVVRRPWTVPFHGGLRMVCHPHDQVTSLVIYCGLYDPEEMRFLLDWLRPGDTFVDVGANVAPYSLLSTLVPDTRAVAFEPGSLARRRARANIDLNGLGDRIELVPLAVSDATGTARLSDGESATNALVGNDYPGPVEEVATVTLDGFDAGGRLGRVGLIKIDVEGLEPAVLDGARALIDRDRPALVVELNDVPALRAFTMAAGYEPVRYRPAGRALEPRPWPDRPGGNVILVPDLTAARRRLSGR
ncbi:MAG TPA: FkbM family methyltransferase [Acidimicrobiales bacterium]